MSLYQARIVADDDWSPYRRLAAFSESLHSSPDAQATSGAIASFIGLVRGHTSNRTTTETEPLDALILEHYPEMTEKSLNALVSQAKTEWQLTGCLVEHRIGRLAPATPIVLVACAAPHRAAALSACQFLMDKLKTDAPFWKQEVRTDGTVNWLASHDTYLES